MINKVALLKSLCKRAGAAYPDLSGIYGPILPEWVPAAQNFMERPKQSAYVSYQYPAPIAVPHTAENFVEGPNRKSTGNRFYRSTLGHEVQNFAKGLKQGARQRRALEETISNAVSKARDVAKSLRHRMAKAFPSGPEARVREYENAQKFYNTIEGAIRRPIQSLKASRYQARQRARKDARKLYNNIRRTIRRPIQFLRGLGSHQ